MRLMHLGLLVADQERSQDFYATYFGFDPATASRYDDGTIIVRNREGFDLALHTRTGAAGQLPEFLHFGFTCERPEEVRAMHERLLGAGLPVIEWADEPDLVSVKCLDPDGYPVETYWEPRRP